MAEDINHLPEMAAALRTIMSQVVRKAALDIEAAAKASAPVDTGYLKNSIYTATSSGANGDPGDFPAATVADDQTAIVAVGAEYGIFVELGTSRMPARPYLIPAAEAERAALAAVASALISAKLGELGVK